MRERKVSEVEVEHVVNGPDIDAPANRNGGTMLRKRMGPLGTLVVIVDETPDFIRVVTAYWQKQ